MGHTTVNEPAFTSRASAQTSTKASTSLQSHETKIKPIWDLNIILRNAFNTTAAIKDHWNANWQQCHWSPQFENSEVLNNIGYDFKLLNGLNLNGISERKKPSPSLKEPKEIYQTNKPSEGTRRPKPVTPKKTGRQVEQLNKPVSAHFGLQIGGVDTATKRASRSVRSRRVPPASNAVRNLRFIIFMYSLFISFRFSRDRLWPWPPKRTGFFWRCALRLDIHAVKVQFSVLRYKN